MAKPVFRITFSRKDGEEITFTNFREEEVTKKYAPLGALFPRDKGEGYSLAIDPAANGHKIDGEKYWYNVYPCDDKPAQQQQQRRGKPSGKSRKDDGDLEF